MTSYSTIIHFMCLTLTDYEIPDGPENERLQSLFKGVYGANIGGTAGVVDTASAQVNITHPTFRTNTYRGEICSFLLFVMVQYMQSIPYNFHRLIPNCLLSLITQFLIKLAHYAC